MMTTIKSMVSFVVQQAGLSPRKSGTAPAGAEMVERRRLSSANSGSENDIGPTNEGKGNGSEGSVKRMKLDSELIVHEDDTPDLQGASSSSPDTADATESASPNTADLDSMQEANGQTDEKTIVEANDEEDRSKSNSKKRKGGRAKQVSSSSFAAKPSSSSSAKSVNKADGGGACDDTSMAVATTEASETFSVAGTTASGAEATVQEELMIRDVALRMLPKPGSASEKYLTTPREFDLSKDLRKHLEKREKMRTALKTGFRTKEQAMSEFKTIQSNIAIGRVGELIRKKKKARKEGEDDDDGNGEMACQCTKSCGGDCLNRGLQIECNPKLCPVELKHPGSCQNQRISKGKKPRTEVRVSQQKGCGLFALEKIPKGTYVIEYVGEVVDERECARRLAEDYVDEKHKYLMCMNGGLVIDATRKGNVARFINHSCDPNCAVEEWRVRGQPRMGIFAIKDIGPNEELCFNYNFQRFGENAQECHCGAKNCRRWLGRTAEEDNETLRMKLGLGQDPVLHDHVGQVMDEANSRKAETVVMRLLDNFVPEDHKRRIRREGLFLLRNVRTALDEVYDEGGLVGWKRNFKEPSI